MDSCCCGLDWRIEQVKLKKCELKHSISFVNGAMVQIEMDGQHTHGHLLDLGNVQTYLNGSSSNQGAFQA